MGSICRCSLTVSCLGQPPVAGTIHTFARPLIFVITATLLPSGDQELPPICRVVYIFSIVTGSTSLFCLLTTVAGSLNVTGGCWIGLLVPTWEGERAAAASSKQRIVISRIGRKLCSEMYGSTRAGSGVVVHVPALSRNGIQVRVGALA